MKRNILYIMLIAVSVGLLVGCASSKRNNVVSVSPSPYVLTPDGSNRVRLDMSFHVPEHYMTRRSRLIITPQLMADDSVKEEYMPVVLDAPIYSKKKERLEKLTDYNDPYGDRAQKADKVSRSFDLPYTDTIQLPDGTDEGRIRAVISVDGCGDCAGVDTIDMAAISNPIALMPDVLDGLKLSWIEPEFVVLPKVMKGKGVANLQFAINRHDINLTMGNNRREMENMLETLSPILNDSLAIISSIEISGMSSADGSLKINTPIARNRAISAKEWLVSSLNIKPSVQRLITVSSHPEGWQPVLDLMIADGNPDSVAVKDILTRYADENDDVQERYIRRLPIWDQIKTKYLQKARKVEYIYTYSIKSFTDDAELLDMYSKRPDAFNEQELLRVASLAADDTVRKEVYQTLVKYFPQSEIGVNNLAVLLLREGKTQEARDVIEYHQKYTPEMLNSLAASYIYTGDYDRATELLQGVELPEARYNLGLLKAKQRKLEEAYELLRPFADLNSAICALSVDKNDEAQEILSASRDNTPLAEYVRSLTAARMMDDDVFFEHIGNALDDQKLRRRAITEPDFDRYRNDSRFLTLINK